MKITIPYPVKGDVTLVITPEMEGMRTDYSRVGGSLYGEDKPSYINDTSKAIPYDCWNNRGRGEMIVWMRET